MSVAKALKKGDVLGSAVQPGKQALQRIDRSRVEEGTSIKVVDSLDLDGATRGGHSRENRWDYLIGVSRADCSVVAVEVHPASAGQAKTIVAKKKAAQNVLRSSLVQGAVVHRWYWVASGKTTLTRNTPEARLLDANGIRLVGRQLSLERDL
jgi:hypothetical protein